MCHWLCVYVYGAVSIYYMTANSRVCADKCRRPRYFHTSEVYCFNAYAYVAINWIVRSPGFIGDWRSGAPRARIRFQAVGSEIRACHQSSICVQRGGGMARMQLHFTRDLSFQFYHVRTPAIATLLCVSCTHMALVEPCSLQCAPRGTPKMPNYWMVDYLDLNVSAVWGCMRRWEMSVARTNIYNSVSLFLSTNRNLYFDIYCVVCICIQWILLKHDQWQWHIRMLHRKRLNGLNIARYVLV